ncbi:MAG: RNA polymerase sigma factor [Bacteroidales bacterium]|nr:RNA polymerase sigma factor [Bacteroidales bacterium]MBQ4288000.1 RNA polymerase sigma factor [Bacteroidales bacterium]
MSQQEQLFNQIVKDYSEKIYWHVRRFVYSHEDADDLVQEIFVKIWKSLPSFRGEANLYTWIYRIATNEALNFLRRRKVRAALMFQSLDEETSRQIDEDPWFDGTALQRKLAKAVAALPTKQRLVFNMKYFGDMKYEDIAQITGTSVGALKASYHIACEKLKSNIGEDF